MIKKYSQLFSLVFVFIFSAFVATASAIDLDDATRTVVADSSGKTIVLTPEQVKRGKRLFNATCGACHVGGITKTNTNISLDPEALSLATPRRDSIESLVDFMKNPTTYDGFESIAEKFTNLPFWTVHLPLLFTVGLNSNLLLIETHLADKR